jgi:hypothetical protein
VSAPHTDLIPHASAPHPHPLVCPGHVPLACASICTPGAALPRASAAAATAFAAAPLDAGERFDDGQRYYIGVQFQYFANVSGCISTFTVMTVARFDRLMSQRAKIWREKAVDFVLINKSRHLLWKAAACLRFEVWKRRLTERYCISPLITTMSLRVHVATTAPTPTFPLPRYASASASRCLSQFHRMILSMWLRAAAVAAIVRKMASARHASHLQSSFFFWRRLVFGRSLNTQSEHTTFFQNTPIIMWHTLFTYFSLGCIFVGNSSSSSIGSFAQRSSHGVWNAGLRRHKVVHLCTV